MFHAGGTQRKTLIVDYNGRQGMCCPRCEHVFDILQFVPLKEIKEYAHDTTPVYKCPSRLGGCGFIFAPSDNTHERAWMD